jgi:hypothetical protein
MRGDPPDDVAQQVNSEGARGHRVRRGADLSTRPSSDASELTTGREPAVPGRARHARRGATAAAATLLAVGLLSSAARAATPPDLTGAWVVSTSPSAPAWELQASAGLGTLFATYTGAPGPHEHLVGRFSGALNPEGTAYIGTDQVSELGNNVRAAMTFRIDSPGSLTVAYQSPSGVSTLNLNKMIGSPDAVQIGYLSPLLFDFSCVSVTACTGEATAVEETPNHAGNGRAQSVAGARRSSKKVILGSVRLSVQRGHARRVSLSLSKKGRKLVARSKSGSVQALVQVALDRSSGLPRLTTVGTVTFHR